MIIEMYQIENVVFRKEIKMNFRPCIDIHEGAVKQIVGGSLQDHSENTKINFVSRQDAAFYARFYKSYHLTGGHIILLTPPGNPYYEKTKQEALNALKVFPGGLQVGGGITSENAALFLDAGASHVIVTSYVFKNGQIFYDNLRKLLHEVGKDRVVLDLSCRKKNDCYYIVTDRWQKYTDVVLTTETMHELAEYCDEFLIHAVDVEGKASGIETGLVRMLGKFDEIPVTYAGGIHCLDDIDLLKKLGNNHIDATIGSALDLFGGTMDFQTVLDRIRK